MYTPNVSSTGITTLDRVVISHIRGDGLIFAQDFSLCDHSGSGHRKVMFRNKLHYPFVVGAVYMLEYASEDALKPIISKSHSKKTTYITDHVFLHKIANVRLVSTHPDADLLYDL